MSEPELRESWFEKQPPSAQSSGSLIPPPPPPKRGPRFGLGVIAGALASAVGLEVARLVAQRLGSPDPLEMTSRIAGGSSWARFAVAALAGAPFGGLLAVVMMHGSRFIPRAIFASAVSVAIWFCVHLLFVIRHAAAPPLVPMLVGAGVYGACLAVLPRARR